MSSPRAGPARPARAAFAEYAGLDRRIWILAAVRAVNTMALSLAMAFMAIHLVTARGISGQACGWIFFAANLAQALAQGYAGELSDRVGRRRVMVAALVLRALALAGLGALVLVAAPIPLLALLLVVNFALRGGFEPVAYAVVADVAAPSDRVAGFGLQRMGTNLGWAIGPALGGLLAAWVPYGAVFFFAAPVILLSAWATARVEEPPRPAAAPRVKVSLGAAIREAAGRADLTLFLCLAFLFAVAHLQIFTTFSIFVTSEIGLSKAEVGLVYTVNGLAVLLLQMPAIRLIGRTGTRRALVIASGLYWLAFAGIGLSPGLAALLAAVFVVTAGEVVLAPAQQALAAELGDPARLGRAFGLLGTMQMLGVAIAPLLGGIAYDTLRDRPLLMWGAVLGGACAAALVGSAWFERVKARDRERARAP